ncbi:hypothetical protein [Haloechinothrix sp. LS1_15]|uniref:hypothetical protein n=1 Tax=Haloechinothrix sp. LS1_15 TaxID=2652248 RepID=UPI0029446B7E|nr:hypothetical protein [Haloechinothrix sp. LS1_15]MDV6012115.1 hypothetical protein [Haloechinothrix sp. LS1_15]
MPLELLSIVLSSVVAIGVIIWETHKYFLEGARVRIYLNPGTITVDENGRSQLVVHPDKWSNAQPAGRTPELAVLDIVNAGRTGVTLSHPGLHARNFKVWPFGKIKQTDKYRPQLLGLPSPLDKSETKPIVRIEPLGRTRFIFDAWHVLLPLIEDNENAATVRGSVTVAGRRRRKLSSFRKRWSIPKESMSFLRNDMNVGYFIYRSMWWRSINEDCGFSQDTCIDIADQVLDISMEQRRILENCELAAIITQKHHREVSDQQVSRLVRKITEDLRRIDERLKIVEK